jgi:uncharacterized protein YcaQ
VIILTDQQVEKLQTMKKIGRKLIAKHAYKASEIPKEEKLNSDYWEWIHSPYYVSIFAKGVTTDIRGVTAHIYDITVKGYEKKTVLEKYQEEKKKPNVIESGVENKSFGWFVVYEQ